MKGRRHARTCRHCPRVRELGRDFQCWRASWEARREQESSGYATEAAMFTATNPAPTFKSYLLANVGAGWPMSGRAEA